MVCFVDNGFVCPRPSRCKRTSNRTKRYRTSRRLSLVQAHRVREADMRNSTYVRCSKVHFAFAFLAASAMAIILAAGCGGGSSTMQTPATGMIQVTISDPPSCTPPGGPFKHVFITVRSVQAHISASADDSTPGWQELAPQLVTQPMQIDLFSSPQTNCILAQLGSASLPAGTYQQIRLLLLSNSSSAPSA